MNNKSVRSSSLDQNARTFKGLVMIEQLRQYLLTLQKPAGIEGGPGTLPLGISAIDTILGGGLMRGALHEIAAPSEAHLTAAAGFTLGLATLSGAAHTDWTPSPLRGEGWGEGVLAPPSSVPPHPTSHRTQVYPSSESLKRPKSETSDLGCSVDLSPQGRGERRRGLLWIAEDMALAETGTPYGAGLDAFGLAPEQLVTVSVAHRRDLLWAMEEALRCRAVDAVIGEMRAGRIDGITVRRLSLAAAESGALALLLRAAPPHDTSTAATRWIVGAARADLPPPEGGERNARFDAQLIRNRRGPLGSWILEWSDCDERFILATHTQPVAAPTFDRPHRQVA